MLRIYSASWSLVIVMASLLVLPACEPPEAEMDGPALQDDANQYAFVTRLGEDTVAVERITWREDGMDATVLIRPPETTMQTFRLDTTPEGALTHYERTVRDPGEVDAVPPTSSMMVMVEGDSLMIQSTQDGETETQRVAAEGAVVPFMDYVHWPFEWALRKVYASGADSMTVHFFTGRNTMPFVIRRLAEDSMSIQHPFRGTMGVRVDDEGRLVHLDASETTRKLTVDRVADVDIEGLAERFAGQSFGELSSRGEAMATVDGATISIDYGVPQKRGREIWGALVPWGEVWRTGANRATHFTTDTDLMFGDPGSSPGQALAVPAGEYTLYTIPEADGGTLIINRQTGQGGTTYNEDQDLGRVPMTTGDLPETVEPFTIQVEDTDEGGVLRLQWDRTEFRVPFTVQ